MREGWEIKKLGEIASFKAGKSTPASDITNKTEENKYPCYGGNGIRGYVNRYSYDGKFSVIGRVGALCGNVYYVNEKFYATEHAIVASLLDDRIEPKWFSLLLNSLNLRRIAKGVAQPVISSKQISEIQIRIPSYSEQINIVEELDLLNGILDKKRQQLNELDSLSQSIFYDMFGDPIANEKRWNLQPIKDIAKVKIGPFGSLLHNSDYIKGGVPLVNPIHMQNERIVYDDDFTVSKEKYEELTSYVLHERDIILARRGEIGRCALVSNNEDGFICGTGSLFFRPIENYIPLFVIKQLRCNSMIEHLTSLAKGATMLNINCSIVENLKIILPPITLQNEFADKIKSIERQKQLIKASIAETQTLLDSRMDYYFN